MDGDKGNSREADATELSETGKYNHLPEDSVTSNMVSHRGAGDDDEKNSPEGGKLLAGDGAVATEVKFISPSDDAHNGDANISIEAVKIAFAGMGKEELMKFANDPFWIRLRWFLFILFWLLWAGMLAIAIVIIVMAPKCAAPAPKTWWEQSPVYQIHVPSFKEGGAEHSGKGNLKGIQEKLDYLSDLGIQGVAISPVMKTSGTSDDTVENFIDIDSEYGLMEDFVSLTTAMKDKGIHLIMRFVPNHSSSKHPWFAKSVKKEEPYTDYYIWAPKKGIEPETGEAVPPNNWLSVNGGSAWEWNSERDAFYLHQFGKDQPDLNFTNPLVIEEFQKIFEFWIKNGVSGFLLDKVEFLLEDAALRDEVRNMNSKAIHDEYDYYTHYRTTNQPGLINILELFKETIKNNTDAGVLATTANVPSESLLQYYGEGTDIVVDLPFYHKVLSYLVKGIDASSLQTSIEEWLFRVPNGTWPNWEIGSPHSSRLATRVSPGMIDGIHMVFMLLPGTPVTYYGDELGMEDLILEAPANGSTIFHPAQGLMQWSNTTNGGFSYAASTWIKASDSCPFNNVERQVNAPESHYKVFKTLIEARKSPSIMYGSRQMHVLNETVLAYTRVKSGSPGYLVLFNLGETEQTVDLSPFSDIPGELTVLTRSVGFKDDSVQIKSKPKSYAISLASHDALVLTYVPKDKD